MANYGLVVNSTFNPFSYQELAAPLDRQELYHEKLAEEYDKLSTQADVLEAMGQNNRDKNSGTYAKYKAYSDALRKEADDLYRFGLNTESRQRLTDLRRRYNTDIVPIQNAWQKRKEEVDLQTKARIQHPELRFTRDAANTSLEEYINNPEGGFGVVNLNNIAAQMSAAAQNLSKQIRAGVKVEGIDGFTNRVITQSGLDPQFIADWQSNPNISPTLTSMMHQILEANGLNEEFLNTPNGASIMQEAINAAKNGAWNAVGEDKSQIIDNFIAREEYKHNMAVQDAAQAAMRNEGNVPLFFDQLTSPNLEGEAVREVGQKANQVFGNAKKTANGYTIPANYTKNWGNLRINTGKGSYFNGGTNAKNTEITIAANNGRLLTRDEFIQKNRDAFNMNSILPQRTYYGSEEQYKKALEQAKKKIDDTIGKFYDENLGSQMSNLGIEASKQIGNYNPTLSDLTSAASVAMQGGNPISVNALELRFGEAREKNKKVLEGLLPSLRMADDKTYIKEIQSIKKSGEVVPDKKYIDAEEFIDADGNAKDTPLFYRINSPEGSNSIIMKYNGKSYLLPGKKLGNIFGESNVDVDRMAKLHKKRQQLIDTYGEEAYWSDPIHVTIENGMNSAGAASVRRVATSMAGGYRIPQFGLTTEKE